MKGEKPNAAMKCADCLHAKQFREINRATGRYVLKVRCDKGHWQRGKKAGDCDLYRVLARCSHKCRDYESMSESEEERQSALRNLSMTLPLERIVYGPDGEALDMDEVMPCRIAQ